MPKTKVNYKNNIGLKMSDKLLMAIENARRSNGAKEGFGVVPTRTEFLRGVIYYWIRKNAPEVLDLNGDIPEVIEHKKLKDDQAKQLSESQKLYEKYFRSRKDGDKS